MTTTVTLINGEAAGVLDPHDRGLHYGDGVFETLIWHQNQSPLWPYHYERLQQGCHRLAIPVPDRYCLEDEIAMATQTFPCATVKIIMTRGVGERGYAIPVNIQPTRIIQAAPWTPASPNYRTDGVDVFLCQLQLSNQPQLAGIKHLNRLEQVLARAEQSVERFPEGILSDQHGNIIEAIAHNLFMVAAGKLLTPRLDNCGVSGVIRRLILEQATQWGLTVTETPISRDRLLQANEVFLCNSVHGIWPVRKIDNHYLGVGDITRQISGQVQRWLPHLSSSL